MKYPTIEYHSYDGNEAIIIDQTNNYGYVCEIAFGSFLDRIELSISCSDDYKGYGVSLNKEQALQLKEWLNRVVI